MNHYQFFATTILSQKASRYAKCGHILYLDIILFVMDIACIKYVYRQHNTPLNILDCHGYSKKEQGQKETTPPKSDVACKE